MVALFKAWMWIPWTRWVGFRYLKSKKQSQFLSLITLISLGGVGLGVASMIIVLSVMDGFEKEIQKRIFNADLHLLIQPTRQTPEYERGLLTEKKTHAWIQASYWLEKSQGKILFFWPVLATEVILKSNRKVKGMTIKGVPSSRLDRLSLLPKPALWDEDSGAREKEDPSCPEASKGLPSFLIGQELASEMGLLPGMCASLLSPTQMEGPFGNLPRTLTFRVRGIYQSGWVEQELSTLYTTPEEVNAFLKRDEASLTHWELFLQDVYDAPQWKQQLQAQLPPHLKVKDWGELNAPLFASLKWERIAMFVALGFIVLVASFNILTTLNLMVLKKQKEISILKAMGASHAQVGAIFLAEGLWIGGLGILGGLGLGVIVCWILSQGDWLTLPDIFYDRSLPVTFSFFSYLMIAGAAFGMVLLACLIPSQKAAQVSPMDGIRQT